MIPDGSQDELRWGDPSQLFNGHDSSDLESSVALLPSQCGEGVKSVQQGTKGEKQITRQAETETKRKKCLGNKLLFDDHKKLLPVQQH